jgi:TetR/AcrR family fatty acid metabolism transcriptional regulator
MRRKEGNKGKDILEAAIKIFAEYGYHKAKISKIAEEANVAAGSVYVYYSNKEDLLLKIFEGLWERLYRGLKKIADNAELNPEQKVDNMIDIVFDAFTENRSLAMVFVNEQNYLMQTNLESFTEYYEKFLDQAETVLKQGIKKGVFSDKISKKIFRYFVFGAVRNILHNWAYGQIQISIPKIKKDVKYFIKNGIMK